MAVNPQIPSTQVVGWPGARLAVPLIAGDIILRGDHGRRRRATMIARSRLVPRKDVRGRRVQARESGFYVETISEAGIERILGPEGLLLPDVMIVRSRDDSGSGESDPPVTPRPMVRSGSRGLVVREAQERLNVAHYRNIDQGGIGLARCPLTTDGVFGANTRAAVRAFQRHVFPDDPRAWDGILGPKTWATLIAASGLPKVSAPPVIDDPQPATFSESPESPAPLYLRQGDNPGDPLDRYRIRGSLYSKEYQMWAAFDPSGLIRTSSAIGPEESRLAMDGPPGLAIGKELMRFENGRLGEFVLKFNEFTLYFDEVLRSIGRLRDLLSAGAPEAPTDLTLLQKRSLRPTDDFQPSRSRKQAYSDWRLRQRAYAALRSTGREHELARHAYWRAHGQLLRTLATQIDKPTFESIALSLGDIASAVTGGWAGVLVVLGDKLIETHKNRAEYNEAMKRFQELLKKTKAQVRDELEAMTEAGTVYWDNLEKYRKAIQAREEARASTREAAASLGQELLSPAERRGQMASEIRMPPMVSDAWRALALAGPTAFVKLSAVLKAGPLIERAVFHFAKPDPTRTSDIAAVIKAFKQAQSWKGVLTKDDVNEWIAVDKLWNETFEKFYR